MGDTGASPDPYPPVPMEMHCSPLTQHVQSLSESRLMAESALCHPHTPGSPAGATLSL